jgi:transcriptional regulator with XRE-family HTH domain/tetratricopeptide (TPR) repeat protein
MAPRRQRLVDHRKALGYSQESLAEQMSVDRTTVARWERGQAEPQPYIRPKLARLLQITPLELDSLLVAPRTDQSPQSTPRRVSTLVTTLQLRPGPDTDVDELDDMNRRELLRLLSVTGTLVALPPIEAAPADDSTVHVAEVGDIEQYEALNLHLWQVFSLSTSKRLVYPLVRQQLGLLTEALERSHSEATHQQLCVLAGDLFQLAGEICFDGNRYTDAAHCYTLAATASKEATAYDLWACALTRHAFIGMYERRFASVASTLSAACRIAAHGDSNLGTRYWVAAVQAEAYAGLGDFDACNRALDSAESVRALSGGITRSGWLRFDGSRLAEERGTCYISLGKPELAEVALSEALDQGISLRRRGSVLSDLAMLGVQRRDVGQIVHYGGMAVELAKQTGSSGYIGRKLDGLQLELRPLLSDTRIANLNEQIVQLSG